MSSNPVTAREAVSIAAKVAAERLTRTYSGATATPRVVDADPPTDLPLTVDVAGRQRTVDALAITLRIVRDPIPDVAGLAVTAHVVIDHADRRVLAFVTDLDTRTPERSARDTATKVLEDEVLADLLPVPISWAGDPAEVADPLTALPEPGARILAHGQGRWRWAIVVSSSARNGGTVVYAFTTPTASAEAHAAGRKRHPVRGKANIARGEAYALRLPPEDELQVSVAPAVEALGPAFPYVLARMTGSSTTLVMVNGALDEDGRRGAVLDARAQLAVDPSRLARAAARA